MHHFLFYCLLTAVKLYSVCVSSCTCWNIHHENEVSEPEGLSQERKESVGVYCKSLHQWWSSSQSHFSSTFLSFFCDSCSGFLKKFATQHGGHHSSLSPLYYTFLLFPSSHSCFYRNTRFPSRLRTISAFFFLTVTCALPHCHQGWKQQANLLADSPVYVSLQHLDSEVWDVAVFCLFCFSGGKS